MFVPVHDDALFLGDLAIELRPALLVGRQLASDAARIVAEECRLMEVSDPLAGSYYVESLTNQYEAEISALIEKIDSLGGAVAAVESGWMKEQVVASAKDFQRAVGRMVKLQVDGRGEILGTLAAFEGNTLSIQKNEQTETVCRSEVLKASLHFEI